MLEIRVEKDTITGFDLIDKINELRNLEKNKSNLKHNDLLKIVRDKSSEKISLSKTLNNKK